MKQARGILLIAVMVLIFIAAAVVATLVFEAMPALAQPICAQHAQKCGTPFWASPTMVPATAILRV